MTYYHCYRIYNSVFTTAQPLYTYRYPTKCRKTCNVYSVQENMSRINIQFDVHDTSVPGARSRASCTYILTVMPCSQRYWRSMDVQTLGAMGFSVNCNILREVASYKRIYYYYHLAIIVTSYL